MKKKIIIITLIIAFILLSVLMVLKVCKEKENLNSSDYSNIEDEEDIKEKIQETTEGFIEGKVEGNIQKMFEYWDTIAFEAYVMCKVSKDIDFEELYDFLLDVADEKSNDYLKKNYKDLIFAIGTTGSKDEKDMNEDELDKFLDDILGDMKKSFSLHENLINKNGEYYEGRADEENQELYEVSDVEIVELKLDDKKNGIYKAGVEFFGTNTDTEEKKKYNTTLYLKEIDKKWYVIYININGI